MCRMASMKPSSFSTLIMLMQLAGNVGAYALPLQSINIRQAEINVLETKERTFDRLPVVIVCLLFAIPLALVQGYRAGRIVSQEFKIQLSDILVFVQGFACTSFLVAIAIVAAGLGTHSNKQCYNAIRICIAFYSVNKIPLSVSPTSVISTIPAYSIRYLFLLERVHIVRAPLIDRRRDSLFVVGVVVTTSGFLGTMCWQSIRPIHKLSPDGVCRIGFQPEAGYFLMPFDTVVNLFLTGIFIWQLRSTLAPNLPRMHSTISSIEIADGSTNPTMLRASFKEVRKGLQRLSLTNMQKMLIRTIVGSILMLAINLVTKGLMSTQDFARVSHICLLMCLNEVCLDMLITQWLTMRSPE